VYSLLSLLSVCLSDAFWFEIHCYATKLRVVEVYIRSRNLRRPFNPLVQRYFLTIRTFSVFFLAFPLDLAINANYWHYLGRAEHVADDDDDDIVPRRIIWSWYTGHWWVGIWYSEEETGRGCSPSKPLLAVPNVTANPSTASVPITVLRCNGALFWWLKRWCWTDVR